LPENYRCPKEALQLANALISHHPYHRSILEIEPLTSNTDESLVQLYGFSTYDDEIDWLSEELIYKYSNNTYDCVILSRTNKLLDIAIEKLKNKGLPVYHVGRKDEFRGAPLRTLISLLRLANSRGNETEDLNELKRLSQAFFELEQIPFSWSNIITRSAVDNKNLLHSWVDELLFQPNLPPDTRELLEIGLQPLLNFQDFSGLDDKIFVWATNRLNNQLNSADDIAEFNEERLVWKNILSDISNKYHNYLSLSQLLNALDLEAKTPPPQVGSIPCLSIQSSSGFEFNHVYLIGFDENYFTCSTSNDINKSFRSYLERRNCFNAITKTKISLTMTYSKQTNIWNKISIAS
jgi:DNA helicase-2/ATP-dependent DNA helicase PcrA